MKDLEQIFFELIRVAIGTQSGLTQTPSASEWKKLYVMAKKQSLVGVCFAGVQRLKKADEANGTRVTENLPEMGYVKWMGMAAKIQRKNEKVNRQCVELQEMLAADGLRSCILKGQGVGLLYAEHLVGLRQSGDIDMWVKGGFDVVNSFVQRTIPTCDIAYHRFHYNVFDDTEVELHHRPTLMRNLFDNRKLQKWCDSFDSSSFVHIGKERFYIPPANFNRIFILTHIYRHFLFEGVGLRQIMDYYFVLRTSKCGVGELTLLKNLRLSLFASAVMWVLKEKFGLKDEYLICKPNEKEGKYLFSEIIYTGNFGNADIRFVNNSTFERMTKRGLHLIFHYPSEVIWTPVWLIYHKIWKMKSKLKIRYR